MRMRKQIKMSMKLKIKTLQIYLYATMKSEIGLYFMSHDENSFFRSNSEKS
jgi:hypothetical protein